MKNKSQYDEIDLDQIDQLANLTFNWYLSYTMDEVGDLISVDTLTTNERVEFIDADIVSSAIVIAQSCIRERPVVERVANRTAITVRHHALYISEAMDRIEKWITTH